MLFYLFCMFDDYWRINHRSRNSAGKASSRHQFYEDYILTKNILKLLLSQMTGKPRGETKVGPEGPTPCPCAGPPPGARPHGVVALANMGQPPFAYFFPPKP